MADLRGEARRQLPKVAIAGSSVVTRSGTRDDLDDDDDEQQSEYDAQDVTRAKLLGGLFGLGAGLLLGAVGLGAVAPLTGLLAGLVLAVGAWRVA